MKIFFTFFIVLLATAANASSTEDPTEDPLEGETAANINDYFRYHPSLKSAPHLLITTLRGDDEHCRLFNQLSHADPKKLGAKAYAFLLKKYELRTLWTFDRLPHNELDTRSSRAILDLLDNLPPRIKKMLDNPPGRIAFEEETLTLMYDLSPLNGALMAEQARARKAKLLEQLLNPPLNENENAEADS